MQSGNTSGLANFPTGGGYKVDEVYAEFNVPILADLPGARELSLNAATRHSDYDTFGTTLNSKFGFKWKPIDSLLIRGTWAEGFRAPTIADLYSGGSQSFDFFTDPCDVVYGASRTNAAVRARCAAALPAGVMQPTSASSSRASPRPPLHRRNPAGLRLRLQRPADPGTSTSKTLGFVWSPGSSRTSTCRWTGGNPRREHHHLGHGQPDPQRLLHQRHRGTLLGVHA